MVAGTKYRGEFEERLTGLDQGDHRGRGRSSCSSTSCTRWRGRAAPRARRWTRAPSSSPRPPAVSCASSAPPRSRNTAATSRSERNGAGASVRAGETCSEPTVEQTVEILRGLRERYEASHHGVTNHRRGAAGGGRAGRPLRPRPVPARQGHRPGRPRGSPGRGCALSPNRFSRCPLGGSEQLRAGARRGPVDAEDYEPAREWCLTRPSWRSSTSSPSMSKKLKRQTDITADDIAQIVARRYRHPGRRAGLRPRRDLGCCGFEELLHRRIVGQNEAVEARSPTRCAAAGPGSGTPGRPVGSFPVPRPHRRGQDRAGP